MDSTPQRGAGAPTLYTPNRRSRSAAPKFPSLGNDSIDNGVDEVEISTVCVVGDRLKNNEAIMADIRSFNLKVVYSR